MLVPTSVIPGPFPIGPITYSQKLLPLPPPPDKCSMLCDFDGGKTNNAVAMPLAQTLMISVMMDGWTDGCFGVSYNDRVESRPRASGTRRTEKAGDDARAHERTARLHFFRGLLFVPAQRRPQAVHAFAADGPAGRTPCRVPVVLADDGHVRVFGHGRRGSAVRRGRRRRVGPGRHAVAVGAGARATQGGDVGGRWRGDGSRVADMTVGRPRGQIGRGHGRRVTRGGDGVPLQLVSTLR